MSGPIAMARDSVVDDMGYYRTSGKADWGTETGALRLHDRRRNRGSTRSCHIACVEFEPEPKRDPLMEAYDAFFAREGRMPTPFEMLVRDDDGSLRAFRSSTGTIQFRRFGAPPPRNDMVEGVADLNGPPPPNYDCVESTWAEYQKEKRQAADRELAARAPQPSSSVNPAETLGDTDRLDALQGMLRAGGRLTMEQREWGHEFVIENRDRASDQLFRSALGVSLRGVIDLLVSKLRKGKA